VGDEDTDGRGVRKKREVALRRAWNIQKKKEEKRARETGAVNYKHTRAHKINLNRPIPSPCPVTTTPPTYIMPRALTCWSVPAAFKRAAICPNVRAAISQWSY